MSAAATTPAEVADAPDPRAARHLAMLERLGEIGMAMAEAIGREALSEPGAEPGVEPGEGTRSPAELAAVFTRIARCVRQTVALEARVAAGVQVRQAQACDEARERRRAEARKEQALRKRDVRDVIQIIIEDTASPVVQSSLRTHLDARLEREAEDSDLVHMPLGEAVARICRDLGLNPDWGDWAEEWACEANESDDRRPFRRTEDGYGPPPGWGHDDEDPDPDDPDAEAPDPGSEPGPQARPPP